ncbi:MAG: InlB B-repeat-containing protein, partial [Clostridiales Family XIII bacterium]|nr:InlB B-repeat-containing protein [Clostridiales Family XIII bacterium]
ESFKIHLEDSDGNKVSEDSAVKGFPENSYLGKNMISERMYTDIIGIEGKIKANESYKIVLTFVVSTLIEDYTYSTEAEYAIGNLQKFSVKTDEYITIDGITYKCRTSKNASIVKIAKQEDAICKSEIIREGQTLIVDEFDIEETSIISVNRLVIPSSITKFNMPTNIEKIYTLEFEGESLSNIANTGGYKYFLVKTIESMLVNGLKKIISLNTTPGALYSIFEGSFSVFLDSDGSPIFQLISPSDDYQAKYKMADSKCDGDIYWADDLKKVNLSVDREIGENTDRWDIKFLVQNGRIDGYEFTSYTDDEFILEEKNAGIIEDNITGNFYGISSAGIYSIYINDKFFKRIEVKFNKDINKTNPKVSFDENRPAYNIDMRNTDFIITIDKSFSLYDKKEELILLNEQGEKFNFDYKVDQNNIGNTKITISEYYLKSLIIGKYFINVPYFGYIKGRDGHISFEIKKNVAVTFNANGGIISGVGEIKIVEIENGSSYQNLPKNVSRKGYTFNGWWTEKLGGVKVKPTDIVENDETIWVHWHIIPPTSPHVDFASGSPVYNQDIGGVFKISIDKDFALYDAKKGLSLSDSDNNSIEFIVNRDYIVYEGSTVIEVNEKYMKNLALGKHNIEVPYKDGYDVKFSFYIKTGEMSDAGENADNSTRAAIGQRDSSIIDTEHLIVLNRKDKISSDKIEKEVLGNDETEDLFSQSDETEENKVKDNVVNVLFIMSMMIFIIISAILSISIINHIRSKRKTV